LTKCWLWILVNSTGARHSKAPWRYPAKFCSNPAAIICGQFFQIGTCTSSYAREVACILGQRSSAIYPYAQSSRLSLAPWFRKPKFLVLLADKPFGAHVCGEQPLMKAYGGKTGAIIDCLSSPRDLTCRNSPEAKSSASTCLVTNPCGGLTELTPCYSTMGTWPKIQTDHQVWFTPAWRVEILSHFKGDRARHKAEVNQSTANLLILLESGQVEKSGFIIGSPTSRSGVPTQDSVRTGNSRPSIMPNKVGGVLVLPQPWPPSNRPPWYCVAE